MASTFRLVGERRQRLRHERHGATDRRRRSGQHEDEHALEPALLSLAGDLKKHTIISCFSYSSNILLFFFFFLLKDFLYGFNLLKEELR